MLRHKYSRTTLNLFYCTCALNFSFRLCSQFPVTWRWVDFARTSDSETSFFFLFCIKQLNAVFTCHLCCILNRSMGVFSNFWCVVYWRTWFLARDAMRKRGLCRRPVSVCLSVRPSVRHVGGLYPDGWRYRQTFCSAW